MERIESFETLHARLRLSELDMLKAWAQRRNYRPADVPKKNGSGVRRLYIPHPELRTFQKALQLWLQSIPMPNTVHGSVRKRSFLTHARVHQGQAAVFMIDLKNAFGQATTEYVRTVLGWHGLAPSVANAVAELTTYQGSLPQGAPSSNALWNLVCAELDQALAAFAEEHGLRYTRYTDELVFSHKTNIPRMVRTEILRIVRFLDFVENERKVHYQHTRHGSPHVTGVSTGGMRTRLTKKRRERYRALIHRAATDWTIPAERIAGIVAHVLYVEGFLPRRIEEAYRHFREGRTLQSLE